MPLDSIAADCLVHRSDCFVQMLSSRRSFLGGCTGLIRHLGDFLHLIGNSVAGQWVTLAVDTFLLAFARPV